MKNYIKDVKPLTIAHVIIPHKKINISKKRITQCTISNGVFKRSILNPISRKQKRNFQGEKSIDLHGYTREEAFLALIRFFNSCQLEGIKRVLVITGGNNLRETTLRKSFKIWIKENFGNYVTSCSDANIWHGGQGAFYVILKSP